MMKLLLTLKHHFYKVEELFELIIIENYLAKYIGKYHNLFI